MKNRGFPSVSARRSKLRKAAAKDAARGQGLAAELERLDAELATALQQHWSAPRELAGLPDAKTKVVESRSPAAAPKPAPLPAPAEDICPRFRALLDTLDSPEVAAAVKAAFTAYYYGLHGNSDAYFNEQLEVAELKYQHALRRLKTEYPQQFCGFGAHSYRAMVGWAMKLEDVGHPIPAAQQAIDAFGFKRRSQGPGAASAERGRGIR